MGLGCVFRSSLPPPPPPTPGKRCENAQLDFKERQHGFSQRFGGTHTRALLKQYRGAVSFIYRDKEKHSFFSWAMVGEHVSENVVVDVSTQCFHD